MISFTLEAVRRSALFPRGRNLRLLLVLVAGLVAAGLNLSPARAASAPDWSGTWDSRWLGGGARVYLRQDDEKVTGRYPAYHGRLQGTVDGRRLIGTWSAPKGEGSFEFILAEDGRSFIGRFGKNQWWTGSRSLPDNERSLKPLQSTPAETLRTFLVAAEAVETGRLEYQDDLISLLAFPQGDEANHARELGPLALLLSQYTVDPDVFETAPPAGDTATLVLTRYDGRALPLEFRRLAGEWFMVPPSPDIVRKTLHDILSETEKRTAPRGGYLAMDTPRATMEVFLDAMRAGPAMQDTALGALDLSEMPVVVRDREAVLAAEYLNEVLARIGEVIYQEIPNDPNAREPFVYFMHPAGDIVLAPTETPEGPRWQFTPETLRSIRSLYAATENLPPAVRILPYDTHSKAPYFRIRAFIASVAPSGLRSAGPLEIWQWFGLAILFGGAALASFVVGHAVLGLRRFISRQPDRPASPGYVWGVRLFAFGAISYAGFAILGLPSEFAGVVKTLAVLSMIAGAIPVEFRVIDRIRRTFDTAGLITPRGDILASLLVGVTKVLIICANILLFAEALRIPYGAALAGLGMGGLAIALAARSMLENVISGFILFADRPVDVGELGRFDGRIGTVEHIGLRATTIRTIDRTLVAIPNSTFVGLHLENYTRRDSILMRRTFALRPETTPDQLRFVLTEIRKLLVGHPKVTADPARVRFTGVEQNRLEVEIFAYVRATEWSEFLAIQEDLFLRIMAIISTSGTNFAYPAQTLYLGRDAGVDAQKAGELGEEVETWRKEGRLPFPHLSAEDIAGIENELPYPPEGAKPESEHPPQAVETPRAATRRSLFWPFSS